MSVEFAFSAELRELRDVVRRFAESLSGEAQVRARMASPSGHEPELWRRLGSELGVLGLALPVDQGGHDEGLVAQAIVVEELGAALFGGPVVGTVLLALPALAAAPPSDLRDRLVGELAAGVISAAVAVPAGTGRPADVATNAVARQAPSGWRLDGTVAQVVDAAAADVLLAVAGTADGPALFAVYPGTGLHRTPCSTLDLTRRQADVSFVDCPAEMVADAGHTAAALTRMYWTAGALLAAEQVGGAARLVASTARYVGQRKQFGRPLGTFQGVKHRCADMLIATEQARTAAYHATWALRDGAADAELEVSLAQAVAGESYYRVAAAAIQLHGGIGFTWEHPAHLYLKRAVSDAALFGTATEHYDRVGARIGL